MPLADVEEVARRRGATINDVVLAMVSGALREYLTARGELPGRPLRAACPVNVRPDRVTEDGNAFTVMLTPLPTHLPEPQERLRYVHAATTARRPGRAGGADRASSRFLLDLLDTVPSAVYALLAGLLASGALSVAPPVATVAVSNVHGPDRPLYFAGARMTHIYGRGMAGPGLGMMVHCASYAGQLDLGLTSLTDLVPDPESLAEDLPVQLSLLRD